jgi:hypothetical protein
MGTQQCHIFATIKIHLKKYYYIFLSCHLWSVLTCKMPWVGIHQREFTNLMGKNVQEPLVVG